MFMHFSDNVEKYVEHITLQFARFFWESEEK
jgi:hypothetical protein